MRLMRRRIMQAKACAHQRPTGKSCKNEYIPQVI